MKIRKFLILIGLAFIIYGCTYRVLPSPVFTAKDFPFTVGSYWKYYFINSFNNTTDTVTATVVANDVSISGMKDLWMVEWRGQHTTLLDTQYVKYTDSLIAFYDYIRSYDSLSIESQYSFPFRLDDDWKLDNNQGRYEVQLDTIPSSHFGRDYGPGYFLKRKAVGENNFSILESLVLVERIGVVYRIVNVTIGFPRRVEAYFLIDYHIE